MKRLSIRIPQKSRQRIPVQVERRRRGPLNLSRRFLNDYWLVPVLVIYMQLMAALMGNGSDAGGLMAQNRTFFSGAPFAARIVAHDFPFAIIGHAKEVWHQFFADTGPSAEAVANRIAEQKTAIYNALWASRGEHQTEVGGVVTLQSGGGIMLHEVPSSNGTFLRRLDGKAPAEVIDILTAPENADMLAALAGNTGVLRQVAHIVASDAFDEATKRSTIDSVLYALLVASEVRYVVLPIDFKKQMGHLDTWRYAGIYHFHNVLNSPPSDPDMDSSYGVRQFVFTLAKDGFDLYDIDSGHVRLTHFQVLPEAWETQPEWAPDHKPPVTAL